MHIGERLRNPDDEPARKGHSKGQNTLTGLQQGAMHVVMQDVSTF